jgi:peptidoglycan/xylan/chitin deacetylase (PgdA/CDA1 family)
MRQGNSASRGRLSKLLFILNFHGLGEPTPTVQMEERPFWVNVPSFEAVLNLIRGREDVVVTFDDANQSDYEIALPALKARNMTGKIFVLVERLDRDGYLSTKQLCTMVSAGLSIGSHGISHRPWTRLNDSDLRKELFDSKNRLEQALGKQVIEAACPFGMYNRRVLRACCKAGYKRVYTTDELPAKVESWIRPRYSILRTHDLCQVGEIVNHIPKGFRKIWDSFKHELRRLR